MTNATSFNTDVAFAMDHEPYKASGKALLLSPGLTSAIHETAPRLLVRTPECSLVLSDPLHCHGLMTY